jgi:Putative transposase
MRLSPLELLEKLAALVPRPRVHLVRYGGCRAPHSHLRGALIPTPRQQGVDEEATDTVAPHGSWARLLKRGFALDMARCPWGQQGALRILAPITQGEIITKILRHLKLTADPPPIAPVRVRPGSLRLVFYLTAPGVSQTRLRQPSSGPPSEVSPFPAGGEGGPAYVLPAPPCVSLPLVCRLPCLAASCTPARFVPVSHCVRPSTSPSYSVCTSPRCPSPHTRHARRAKRWRGRGVASR